MHVPDIEESTRLSEAHEAQQLRQRSERVSMLVERLERRMERPQRSWGAGTSILDDQTVISLPLVERQSIAFELVMNGMPIAIEPGDLIVGNTLLDETVVRPQVARYALEDEIRRASQEGSSIGVGLSHKTPSYYDLLDRGLLEIIEEAQRKADALSTGPRTAERRAFLNALIRECRAVIALAERYADLAESLARRPGESDARRSELAHIATICRRVPAHPPRSFHEAVQSFWLVHYALFSTNTRLSCGRIDQYLWPFLTRDLEAGRISLERAQELVDCLWLRFNDRAQIRRENFFVSSQDAEPACPSDRAGIVVDRGPWKGIAGHRMRFGYAEDAADAINHFGQNVLLAGIRPDGSDGTNALTYLCLNALEKLPFTSPVVTVRLHSGSPPELRRRTAEVLKSGGGMPYINNDDVIVQAYVDLGVPVEDARDYANSNCWETMIEGKSDQELIRGMNFLLMLELALNRGQSRMLGDLGPDTGDPLSFRTFGELMDAWRTQLDHQLRQGIDLVGEGINDGTLEHSSHGRYRYNPLLSALTHDCLEQEQDVIRGGARYTIWHVMGEAVANAIDALAAIKRLVYDEQSVEMQTLLDALAANWDGHEDLRQRIVHRMPKYANNDEHADELGRQMMRFFVERTRYHAARYPRILFPASVGTFSWYAMIGKEVGASADGRRDGEPIAANFSPVPGADLSGPTAAIGSYLSMFVSRLAAGAPIDLRLSAAGLQGDPGTDRLCGLITAFVQLGGNMLTLTVTDAEELKRAMEEPDRYRHLRVRMGGWSAYFVALGREQQLLHIRRVEHGFN